MNISEKGIDLIKGFEGLSLDAYPDPATGGAPWTIGFGWTHPVDGVPVKKGMKITKEKADELLRKGLQSYEKELNNSLKVSVNQNQYDAMLSLMWNIGQGAFKTSTLLKMLNQGDYKGAADQFLRWNRAGGKVMKGLVNRREKERNLFLSE